MTQCVDGQVQLGAALALGAVIPGGRAALGRGAERAAVEDGLTGLDLAARCQAEECRGG